MADQEKNINNAGNCTEAHCVKLSDWLGVLPPFYEDEFTTLYNGDCLSVLPQLRANCADMILCDLPYGTTANEWDTVIDLEKLWKQYERIKKETTAILLFGSQPFTTTLINSKPELFKYSLVWDKMRSCGSMLAKLRPLKYHEDVVVFYEKQPTYNPVMRRGKRQKKASGGNSGNYGNVPLIRYESDQYYPSTIIDILACHNMTGKFHPTEKPIQLAEYLIRTYTNEGEIILDNTCGAGFTLLAAKRLKRKAIGIELSEQYCEITAQRLSQNEMQFA